MKTKNPAYKVYMMAKDRCTNQNAINYSRYGGKGIKFLFDSFESFLKSVGPRPENTTLDRIDSSGNYEDGNLRWTTWDVQANNRTKPKSTFGIVGVHQKSGRNSFIAYSNKEALYIGPDFFEACCIRKSWELQK